MNHRDRGMMEDCIVHGEQGEWNYQGKDTHQPQPSARSEFDIASSSRRESIGLAKSLRSQSIRRGTEAGYTLTEIIIVILIVGIMAAVAIPVIGTFLISSKETATRDELRILARAIAGSDEGADRGFEGDIGFPPSSLTDLVAKPDSIAVWDPFLDLGWNGPYVDSSGGEYLQDAWDMAFVYDPATRSLTSNGSGTGITITF